MATGPALKKYLGAATPPGYTICWSGLPKAPSAPLGLSQSPESRERERWQLYTIYIQVTLIITIILCTGTYGTKYGCIYVIRCQCD
jgi:hypothetical protein